MKKIITLSIVLTAILIACNTGSPINNLLSKPGDIKADEYTIDINRDTTLQTKNGALLKISKGSLAIDKGTTVILEIKEAYSMEQMILAGLTTQSNVEPLSSGGMIYINAKAGQNVTIKQAIKVALPADYLADSMQLFKGETMADGNINWKEPGALPENKQLSAIDEGKTLFQKNCASCHEIGKELIGPDLANFSKRFGNGEEGDYRYHQHGFSYSEGDTTGEYKYYHYDPYYTYKCNLINLFKGAGPRLFNDSSNNLLSIFNYIENESAQRKLPLPAHAYLLDCADSCNQYKQSVHDLNDQKQIALQKKKDLTDSNGELVEEKNTPDIIQNTKELSGPLPPVDFDEKVSPQNFGAVYYQFSIETFGWFNIDVLIKGREGVEESELFVRIMGEYREKVQVYLIIPSVKINVQGGPAERDTKEFAFQYKNGKISLPQNVKAYIMAVSETESSVAYVLKEFTTSTKQEIEIAMKPASKEEFNAAIQSISGNGINIKVADAKNAAEIRKTNTDLKVIEEELKKAESLKPKNCDCDCGWPTKDQAVPAVTDQPGKLF